jgi:hypothetical protein
MVEEKNLLFIHIEFGLADLTLLFFVRAETELLGHLLNDHILLHPVIKQDEVV